MYVFDVFPHSNDFCHALLGGIISINKLPPPTSPYTGEGITKRFPLQCKEGLGEVVIKRSGEFEKRFEFGCFFCKFLWVLLC